MNLFEGGYVIKKITNDDVYPYLIFYDKFFNGAVFVADVHFALKFKSDRACYDFIDRYHILGVCVESV